MAQELILSGVKSWWRSQVVSQGRRWVAMSFGTVRDSVMAKPLSPTVQVMASAELGNTQDPEARTCQASDDACAGPPTTAAAPSAKRALAMMRCGSHW